MKQTKQTTPDLPQKKGSVLRLLALTLPYKKTLLLILLAVLIANIAGLLSPIISARVIDDFVYGNAVEQGLYSVLGLSLLYLAAELISALASILQERMIARMSQGILSRLRVAVYEKITRLSMRGADRYGSGRLITRATNDIETVSEFYSDVVVNLFRDILLLVGILVMLFVLSVRLALIALIAVPLLFAIVFPIRRILKRNFKKMKKITGEINGFIAENISGMAVTTAFHREGAKREEFAGHNRRYFKSAMTQVLLNSVLRPSMDVINYFVIALLLSYSAGRIGVSLPEIGVLYAFTRYVRRFFEPINDLAEKYTSVVGALVSVSRIYELLDDPDVESDRGTYSARLSGEIEFSHVSFAYEDGNDVLHDVSFRIRRGEHVAFVGKTGAGKSTVLSLLSGYILPREGQVLIDGVPTTEWDVRALRAQMASVPQEVFLFTGDVRQNIDMYRNKSDGELLFALRLADPRTAESKEALDRPITEQGKNLSTGQRQLIAFARAAVGDPALLILDEATSGVDSETERTVSESLDRVAHARTLVSVAHRLSTVKDADRIYCMQDGKIAEIGTHEELLALGGIYATLADFKKKTP